ncbi:hypothetical protein [Gordonia sp. NPDC058843]|uniref:hypothetical protein n=1 Tax=Gordonia sp. NPDC058843 TaxID=3346648 RepID=UPI0036757C0C
MARFPPQSQAPSTDEGRRAGESSSASASMRQARVAEPLVPVEQFTARSGVEKWKPDESCSGDSSVTDP